MKRNSSLRRTILLIGVITAAFLLTACGAVSPRGWHGLTVDGDIVYVSAGTGVIALDAASGTPNWSFGTDGPIAPADPELQAAQSLATDLFTPVLANNTGLVVSAYSQAIFQLTDSGEIVWAFDAKPDRVTVITSSAASSDSHVYFASGNNLYALDEVGDTAWTFESDKALWGAPLVTADAVYQPGMNHIMYGLSLDGALLWQTEALEGAFASPPVLVDGVLIAGSLSDHLYGIDPNNGDVLWDAATGGWAWATPSVGPDGNVYIGDLDGNLYAIDAQSGQTAWEIQLNGSIPSTPTLDENILYVSTSGGFLYSIDIADGAINWQVEPEPEFDEQLLASPVIYDSLVIVATTGGDQLVYAFQKENGTSSWIFEG